MKKMMRVTQVEEKLIRIIRGSAMMNGTAWADRQMTEMMVLAVKPPMKTAKKK